ncbi:MAG: ribosome maturation factor RimP [Eubacteriales bacterium]|nr:ribosome maturation factor RimP [Eubacteriales bacterium]
MARRDEYEQRAEAILQPIVDAHQFELVDVEYVKEAGTWYLRAYIDKPGGITVDDCETVSRLANDILDEQDFIEDSYIFEVSSPGLGRPLKKDKDFNRSIGEEVEVRLFRAVNREKMYTGLLRSYDRETVTIELEDESTMQIERANIALIRLAFDF